MFKWLFDRSWSKRSADTGRPSRRSGGEFTVRNGMRYRATVTLGWFESIASNEMIADKLAGVGFTEVAVAGSGSVRSVEATWSGDDTTAALDPHLSNVEELPADPAVAAAPASGSGQGEPQSPPPSPSPDSA